MDIIKWLKSACTAIARLLNCDSQQLYSLLVPCRGSACRQGAAATNTRMGWGQNKESFDPVQQYVPCFRRQHLFGRLLERHRQVFLDLVQADRHLRLKQGQGAQSRSQIITKEICTRYEFLTGL